MKKNFHVAIIPDANRRWAKEKGLEPWKGHEEGAKNLERILEEAKELKITHLTFWGSSSDNLMKRPYKEKVELLKIYKTYFNKLIDSKRVFDNKIKINVVGNWAKFFPNELCDIIQKVIKKTKSHNRFVLTFLLAYSGDDEMIRAVRNIAKDFKRDKIEKINSNTIKSNLFTKDLPPVDLLIRTGSDDDPHLSAGFMMWEIRDAQLYFSNLAWPDFNKKELEKSIKKYNNRERRYGA